MGNAIRRSLLIERWTGREFLWCLDNLLDDEGDELLARANIAATDCLPSGHWCLSCMDYFNAKEKARSADRKDLIQTFNFCRNVVARSRGASHFASIALAVLRWCKDGNVVRPLEGLQDRFD